MGRNRAAHSRNIIEVPDIVGLTVAEGLRAAADADVVLTAADSDGPPPQATQSAQWRIVWQLPTPGSRRNRGEQVLVGYNDQGGDLSGVREPRRPLPKLLPAVAPHEDQPTAG